MLFLVGTYIYEKNLISLAGDLLMIPQWLTFGATLHIYLLQTYQRLRMRLSLQSCPWCVDLVRVALSLL